MLSKEREADIRHVRSQTPDDDPWEAGVVDDLLGEIDSLRERNENIHHEMHILIQIGKSSKQQLEKAMEFSETLRNLIKQHRENYDKITTALVKTEAKLSIALKALESIDGGEGWNDDLLASKALRKIRGENAT